MQDVDNLEKSHSNRVQKQNLVKVPLFRILSIQNTYEQEKRSKKDKLNLPQNNLLR
jgi:hypothetical protein